jgi:thymidylate synthase (FAD)
MNSRPPGMGTYTLVTDTKRGNPSRTSTTAGHSAGRWRGALFRGSRERAEPRLGCTPAQSWSSVWSRHPATARPFRVLFPDARRHQRGLLDRLPIKVSAVAHIAPLRVQLIAKTEFLAPPDVPWTTDAEGGSALVEFAGRACYQSWSKPNPRTATNAGYISHIIDVGHFSVLEHASVSFYITGISRSCTHELIRHRHFSYSQLSQRYVPENDSQVVLPPGVEDDPELREILTAAADASRATYTELLAKLEAKFAVGQPNEKIGALRRKQARQAARAVLPNATETRIVVTGNYRAWRHFIAMRASEHADVEIRRLAIACLRQLVDVAPAVFADFEVSTLADGSEVATSPLATEA